MVFDPASLSDLGVMVGLAEEARILRQFLPDTPVALSHANALGAEKALDRLRQAGAKRLLSFGCAGGLAPTIEVGNILVADRVVEGDDSFQADTALSALFGAEKAGRGDVLHSSAIVTKSSEKQALYRKTGCVAVDMESGIVARSGLPFAVLRVICDEAVRDLPHAASGSLKGGKVHMPALLTSLLRHPGQVGELMKLGRDAVKARKAMHDFLKLVST